MADYDPKQDIMNKLDYLDNTKNLIREALIEKGQIISTYTPFRDYADIIEDMTIGIDTSDATATSYDIIAPYTAYVNGSKLTGRINKIQNDFTFDNQEICLTSSISNIKDYTMTDGRIFHKEYLEGIDLTGKDFLIYMRPNKDESQAIVFTWNNIETLKITLNNNTMTLNSYAGNIITDSLKTYTDLFLGGNPTVTIGTFTSNYFGNNSYYSTNNILSTSDNSIIFNKIESLHYSYITIKQNLNETKAISANIDNKFDIDLNLILPIIESDATATAQDLAIGKTMYVKGQKVAGVVSYSGPGEGNIYGPNNISIIETSDYIETMRYNIPVTIFMYAGANWGINLNKAELAQAIGLTADKIKKDETILGITGTYEGVMSQSEYEQNLNIINNILGIE